MHAWRTATRRDMDEMRMGFVAGNRRVSMLETRGTRFAHAGGCGGVGRLILVLMIVLGASGCYRATFVHPNTIRGQEHHKWKSFYLYGLVGRRDVSTAEVCGETPVSRVQTGGNFGTGIISALTLGIYTPRKVYVTCASGENPRIGEHAENER